MKMVFFITSMLIVQFGFAQLTIKKSSIDSGGETTQNGSTYMLFTIGEVVVNENSTTNLQISEGFINPDILKYLDLEDYQLDPEISVYPNPTTDYINIDFGKNVNNEIMIIDNKGRLVFSKNITDSKEVIDFSSYPCGIYNLLIKNQNSRTYQNVRIIKQ